jgi:hypothetical protein
MKGGASAAYALDSARAVPLAQRLRIEEDWNCAGSDGCRNEDRVASPQDAAGTFRFFLGCGIQTALKPLRPLEQRLQNEVH